jgi:hypothetical protein
VAPVVSKSFEKKMRSTITERKDEWSHDVLRRLTYLGDLVKTKVVYHQLCYTNFETGKKVPKAFDTETEAGTKRRKQGRPSSTSEMDAFERTLKYLDANRNIQHTLRENTEKMQSFWVEVGSDAAAYSHKYAKKLIVERFGNEVMITGGSGRSPCVVTFLSTASNIIGHHQKEGGGDAATDHCKPIQDAVKILKAEMKTKLDSKEFYPEFAAVGSTEENIDYLPPMLRMFLSNLLNEVI